MAKKGQQVQLQAEINSEEEWDKLLERDGLIVVDVYSDWCGPCSAMSANLKKLKLEIGGDNLHLAMAKSDNIECLTRFREKSEPTWMFIVHGKMVNLMFGANAPKLTRLITDELKREESVREGTRVRDEINILDLAPEERTRFESSERVRLENEEIERDARMKAKHERLNLIVSCILQNFQNTGVLVIFPYAYEKHSLLQEIWEPNGIKAGHIEKQAFKNISVEDMLYFTDYRFPEDVQILADEGPCHCYTIKTENTEESIDSIVLKAVYGTSRMPPGSADSFALKMRTAVKKPPKEKEKTEGESMQGSEHEEEEELDGVWVPPNAKTRALAIYMLFPSQALAHVPPEPEPIPPHIAVAYDAFKRAEVMALIEEYGADVLRFGFFTDEKSDSAKLIAKTVVQFEKKAEETTYGEKMIVQLSKKHSDTVLAFAQLGPTYMSPNAIEGEKDCKAFFPKGYDEPEPEEVEVEVKKKSKKRGKRVSQAAAMEESEKPKSPEEEGEKESFVEGEEAGDGMDFSPEMAEDEDGEEEGEGETFEDEEGGEFDDETLEEYDKATSPMAEEAVENSPQPESPEESPPASPDE